MLNPRDKKLWIGVGISGVLLVLLFRKIEFAKLAAAFREMETSFLWGALAFTFMSYFLRAVRWRLLLLPMKRTKLGNLFPATIIGYMANNLLPARLGEFVRAYVLGEKEGLKTSATFATLVLDRLWDGFTVLLILLITFFTVELPPGMESVQDGLVTGGYITLGAYLTALAFLVVLKRQTVRTLNCIGRIMKPFPPRLSEKVIPVLGNFIQGLHLSSRPVEILPIFAISAAIWATAVLPVDLVLQAAGIHLPITASMFIMVFLVFAVMVPAAPGFVGTYHAACVYGLMAFNVPMEKALSVALVVHGMNFFPVIAVGAFYVWRDNLSLAAISSKSCAKESAGD